MREVFAEYTHLATDVDSYLYAIQKALGETEDAELKNARIAFAQTHSWAHSVEKIYIKQLPRNKYNGSDENKE